MAYLNNVLVLELIGDSGPALQLKDDIPDDIAGFMKKIISDYRKLYKSAGLVHGDLSEFNILNYRDSPVLIDFSQTSPVSSPNAEELLRRDMQNLARFCRKHGVKIDERELVKKIKKA
jgi:RIO kinase 1